MQQTATASQKRSDRKRATLLGLILGALQVLLMILTFIITEQIRPDPLGTWWLAIFVLPYVLLPALAGFLTGRERGDTNATIRSGCLVGGIGVLPTLIVIWVAAILLLTRVWIIPTRCYASSGAEVPCRGIIIPLSVLALPLAVILAFFEAWAGSLGVCWAACWGANVSAKRTKAAALLGARPANRSAPPMNI